MKNIKFYLIRLRNASAPELMYRARQLYLALRLRYLFKKSEKPVHVPTNSELNSVDLPHFRGNVGENRVSQILNGKVFNLNSDISGLKELGEKYSDVFFSDVKLDNTFQDIRGLWEMARLQQITSVLAYAYRNANSPSSAKAKEFCKKAVLRWVKDNPFLFGLNYISVMECGLRIPVFFYCLKIIDSLSSTECRSILEAIYLHAWLISRRLSLYSSLGNHTIAECGGLIFAGALFRGAQNANEWLEKGITLLKRELEHQILEDGGPAEQSFNYHRFVLDLYWLTVDLLERNNLYNCTDIKRRLMRGENFLAAFQDGCGSMPSIGDSDDGFAVAPGIAPRKPKSRWIKQKIKTFKHSGYTVINSNNRVTFTFDHGPLGMPPLYNHGHADALSITLTKEDQQILVDPGTYKYNGVPEWRRYFKGTRAHNTVIIDGLDQAVQETGFIWSHPYKVDFLNYSEQSDGLFVEAVHNGYSRLKEPVWHKRSILFFGEANFVIKDSFTGRGVHDFELNYHVHPNATVSMSDGWWRIEKTGTKVFIMLLGQDDFLLVRGQLSPLLGWYSPSYGIKRKSGVLNCTKTGVPGEISFVTVICTESPLDNKGALRFC